jgi:cell division septum initiation protein DivIVA
MNEGSLRQRIRKLEAENENLREHNRRIAKDLAGAKKRIEELEQGVQQEATESEESEPRDDSLTPFEQVLRAGEAGVIGHLTAKDERAQSIGKHFAQWASRAPNGLVIKDNLKNLLETATGENLYWRQVYRSCRALEEATNGAIEFTKHRRYGWILVAQPSFVNRIGQLRSSSVPKG